MGIKNYTTLVEAIRSLKSLGFSDEYKFKDGELINLRSKRNYKPKDLCIVEHHRFEGMTNPGDMSILFAIEDSSGQRGVVVSSYGPYADAKLINFFDQVKIKSV